MGSIEASAIDSVEARVGTTLRDKWHVDSLIGIGGMAAVYAATHRNGNRVALKVLHQQLSVDSHIRSRFRREGYVANLIAHPGIVRVLDDDVTEEGSVFLVMDLLEGETAEARARRLGGRLPIEDVILVADGLLDVIAAAHAAGVIHRDIKPENVFVTLERDVKVLDFGIAGLRDGFAHAGGSGMKTATMMGTPAFMPPEQALGRMAEVDALSDVWAVGASMFNLIAGVLVHEGETANELLILAATEAPRSLAAAAPDAPRQLVEIVDRALAVDKAKRWSSARAMQHALRQAASEILREPLPQPMSGRMRLHPTPAAIRPLPVATAGGLDDTIIGRDGDWNAQSGISMARNDDMRALLLTPADLAPSTSIDTSTLHPTNAAVVARTSSTKRVFLLASVASLVLAIVGSIGVGVAMRSESEASVSAIPPAAARAQLAAHAPSPAVAVEPPSPSPPPAIVSATPAAAELPAQSIELDTPTKPERATPRPAGRVDKKSWLDRRK